ncbi:MAG: gamma-glutamylcyclotransferase [Clostridiales bacterium]|jgi:recombinational DNA repair protein (RecF pathway)|nr:gamma-glutamylcyclotransferase [Clostridiales bacterium]
MDKFLKIQSCERCGARLDLRIMSKMNEDIICLNCFQEERNHPYYEAAAKKEAEEVAAGNYNYRGMFAGQKYPFGVV